jgi:2'-phosphotransferase
MWYDQVSSYDLTDVLKLKSRSIRPLNITLPEVREIVSSNDKQRFSLIHISDHELSGSSKSFTEEEKEQDDDPANYLICANQGHSIKLAGTDAMHKPITLEDPDSMPDTVVHGTQRKAWPLIVRSGGLKPMSRTHVHFAIGLPKTFKQVPAAGDSPKLEPTVAEQEAEPAKDVISGMRNSSTVLIYIDLKKALESRLKFYMSKNGVVLCDGGEKGVIPLEVFKLVEQRMPKENNTLVKDGEMVGTLTKA